jgi:Flp pilus assembly protein TadB
VTPVVLSAIFAASLSLLGLWYVTRHEARLMEVRAKGTASQESAAGFRWLWSHRGETLGAALVGWAIFGRSLPGRWPIILVGPVVLAGSACLIDRYRQSRRLADIRSEWPVLLETMAVGALSGLDLNAAFMAAIRRTEGPLREETEKVALRLAGGSQLSRALNILVKQGIPGAERLAGALLQSEVLGTPVAALLDSLALETSVLERQDIEGRFNTLPLKMSLVTVIFLLPPILVVSIAPHVILFLNSQW